MRWTQFALAASLVALVACARSMPGGTGSPEPAQAAAPHHAQQSAEAQLALGEQLFQRVCSACHSLEGPPQMAPPMTHVARHYRQAFGDRERGTAHMVAFVREPSAERSVLPAHARERWGLMPPLPLPEAELRAVAEYVWQLPEPGGGMGGHRHQSDR
jgi:cytochrome c